MATATYGKSIKRRAKLVEPKTSAAMQKRMREGLGVVLFAAGIAAFAAVWTYDPTDPSLFSATDAAPTNILGYMGASLADPLYRALGWAAYGLPLALLAWGSRFVTHQGERKLMNRMVIAPIAIALGAVFAAFHVPFANWPHAYGLGGMFGDSALRIVLPYVPLELGLTVKSMTILVGLLFFALSLFALGVNLPEIERFLRFQMHGLRRLFQSGWWILGLLGIGAFRAGKAANGARLRRKDAQPEVEIPVEKASIIPARTESGEARMDRVTRSGFGGRMRGGNQAPSVGDQPEEDDERLMARISAAVKAREDAARSTDLIDDNADFGPDTSLVAGEPRVLNPGSKALAKNARARAEEQPKLAFEDEEETYQTPPLSLLENPSTIVRHHLSDEALEENARMLENVLDDYGVKGEITSVRPGPVVTMYELEPAAGLKASRVIGLADDIARSMSALACRVSTIPGRSVIGIELPNANRERVLLREIISSKTYGDARIQLPLALGKDIAGEPVVANLARMPHLLIAGTTGSGKSVAINKMILSLLYQLRPDQCRMIMIDPKMLELSVYDGIPHLLSPVVTDPKKAVVALKWVVAEMEERYRKMSKLGVRNIDGFNGRVEDALAKAEDFTRTVQTGFDDRTGEPVFESETYAPEKMPYIVVLVDEMADLMMVAGKEIEACIQRLAQMARASGIHIIMATQRPSVDVITGTIKANFPTRISFQVTSKIDSRTILGEMGAEQLLGMGDMLYMAGGGRITRVHGPFVSDEEVEVVVSFLKAQGTPEYVSGVVEGPDDDDAGEVDLLLGLGSGGMSDDAMYDQAVAIVIRDRKCSTSYIQRKLSIGYNKAAKLVEDMEDNGIVSQANHVGRREVLIPER